MRRIVVFVLTSLDGAVADPTRFFPHPDADGPSPPGYDEVMIDLERDLIARQSAVLLGREMFDQWSRYWPTSDEQPFADFVNRTQKYVLTSSPLPPSAWSDTTEALSGPLADAVADLRSRPGDGDIGVHGSITLVRSLLRERLADELVLVCAPVVDPQGPRFFEGFPDDDPWMLRLTGCTRTDSGAVWLTYDVSTGSGA